MFLKRLWVSTFWCIICFSVIMLLQFKQLSFHPIYCASVQWLIPWSHLSLHVVSWDLQVVSVLPWADAKQLAGKFFDWSFPFNFLYSFQNMFVHSKFVLSHFSVVYRGGRMTQQTISQWFLHSGVGIWILFYKFSDFGTALFFHILFLFPKKVVWWLTFCTVSCWVNCQLNCQVILIFVIITKVNIKTDCYLINCNFLKHWVKLFCC